MTQKDREGFEPSEQGGSGLSHCSVYIIGALVSRHGSKMTGFSTSGDVNVTSELFTVTSFFMKLEHEPFL